ncbi:low molecular weight phosphatase family protein [Halalkalibaculum sp. DA3122]|uniref:arsenate-mycothiol transferase ArsC n=1 Tax=unclassified Halalkalibaculum TaxID=2964617 RepID=UPI003754AFC5
MNSVLFVCTGNYYRSRMAEELFNFWAPVTDLSWEAHSAGLREDMSKSPNEGPISKHAVRMLAQNGFPVSSSKRYPRSIEKEELEVHNVVICLHRTEHEPMIQKRFPKNNSEILFWEVPDIQYMEPEEAFSRIKRQVHQLISLLSSV